MKKIKIKLELILAIIIMAIFQNKIYFISYFSIMIHELMHLVFMYLYKIEIDYIYLTALGIECNVKTFQKSYYKNIIKLAGPVTNLVIAVIFKSNETIYLVNMSLFIINMIPIKPLDGYSVIEILLDFLKKEKNDVVKQINIIILVIAYIISIYFFVKFSNFYLLIFIICVTIKNVQANYMNCNNY